MLTEMYLNDFSALIICFGNGPRLESLFIIEQVQSLLTLVVRISFYTIVPVFGKPLVRFRLTYRRVINNSTRQTKI